MTDHAFVRRAAAAASSVATVVCLSTAHAQCNYTVRLLDLPPHPQCPTTPASTIGSSINNYGEVAGDYLICSGSHKACRWNAAGQWFAIPIQGQSEGEANAISDAGVIVGGAVVGNDYKWFVSTNGTTTIVNPPCGYLMANGRQICADGTAYGDVYCLDVAPINRVYALTSEGQFIDVWADISMKSDTFVQAADRTGSLIAGQVVQGFQGLETRAFRWWNGVVDILGPVPGGYTSRAYGVNRWGDLCGSGKYHPPGWKSGDPPRAFAYVDGEMIDLGFVANDTASTASDINDRGQIIGHSYQWMVIGGHSVTTLWQHGETHILQDLIVDPLVWLSGAHEFNDRGDILVGGYYGGEHRSLVLEPIRERLGDVDLDCRVDLHDLALVLRTWGSVYDYDHGSGDANNDHVVDAADLANVLGDWDPPRG